MPEKGHEKDGKYIKTWSQKSMIKPLKNHPKNDPEKYMENVENSKTDIKSGARTLARVNKIYQTNWEIKKTNNFKK